MLTVDTIAITELEGVGDKIATKLAKLEIYTLADLLFHMPLRYEDRTQILPIGQLQPHQQVVIVGIIQSSSVVPGRKGKRIFQVIVKDDTGSIRLRFFNFYSSQEKFFAEGRSIRCYGEVKPGSYGLELVHPKYEEAKEADSAKKEIVPVYPSVAEITPKIWQKLFAQAIELLKTEQAVVPEYLHGVIDLPYGSLQDALICIHQPPDYIAVDCLENVAHAAQQRVIIEELLAHVLSLRQLRKSLKKDPAIALHPDNDLVSRFIQHLPFVLTTAQQTVLEAIQADLIKNTPMLRLIQGDVGSGKTIVAAIACLQAIACGQQAVLMAPTDILAEQHYTNFIQWFSSFDISVVLLSGKQKTSQRKKNMALIKEGTAMVIGTHALFQQGIEFNQVALVVIDEQHRFGVEQRLALRDKGIQGEIIPHQLMLTATPIPRTLSMILHADLDVSIIDSLPPGRSPIKTAVLSNQRRQEIIERIGEVCALGRQVYWVCTLIETSEVIEAQAAEVTAKELQEKLPHLKIGLVHGKMKGQEKEAIMQSFKQHDLDLLVATTVIEVGVDVPNASLMIIENPERLGLSQLHQLRGRVGRGEIASSCVLMYQGPLSEKAQQRLQVMRNTQDGFIIAQQDLELRGPGEVLGTKQKGMIKFKIADIARDRDLFNQVQRIAQNLEENEEIIKALQERWLPQGQVFAQT